MDAAVMVLGASAEAAAWWLVAFRGRNVWLVVTPVLAALGVGAILAGPPSWSPNVVPVAAACVGIASGAILYLATRAFVAVVGAWGAFRAHSLATYDRQGSLPVATALLLSVALTVPGEELFWRGLIQPELGAALGEAPMAGAVVSWVTYVGANLPSANLAIVAGAFVGGGVWAALGWWCGGALAPLASHAVWTSLMLCLPVVRREVAA